MSSPLYNYSIIRSSNLKSGPFNHNEHHHLGPASLGRLLFQLQLRLDFTYDCTITRLTPPSWFKLVAGWPPTPTGKPTTTSRTGAPCTTFNDRIFKELWCVREHFADQSPRFSLKHASQPNIFANLGSSKVYCSILREMTLAQSV